LRAIQDGGRGNFKRAIGPIFGSRQKNYFARRDIVFISDLLISAF